jgi:hypothetical protein
MKIVNLTPHDVIVRNESGEKKYPATGQTARVATVNEVVGEIDGCEVVAQTFGEIEGLPEPQPDTYYIVSMVVRQAAEGKRDDLLSPDTSPQGAIRGEDGRIEAVRRFVR